MIKTLEDILEEWETDSSLDETEPAREETRTGKLHSKYLKYYVAHKKGASKAAFDLKRLRVNKWKWVKGALSREELTSLGWEPFQLKLSDPKAEDFIDGDEEIAKIEIRRDYHDLAVNSLDRIIKEISQRHWGIRSIIDWQKFTNGHGL